jgi:lipopolysaccharide assembly protein B
MYELLFILPVLLPLCWYLGFRKGRDQQIDRSNGEQLGLSRQYFTGLNYLLNEESDKAIDTFVGMLEVDSETVETHLALGNLFRKRGEVDRAIRIHQNLIARPALSTRLRKMSLLELGYDYMAAGLLDRAENIFKELMHDQNYKQQSLKQLLTIYQQMKDWENAIAVSEKLQVGASASLKNEIAHFYCELAEENLHSKAPKEAMVFVKKALAVDANSVRATLLKGDINYSLGKYKQAIKTYRDLLRQDIELLSEAIDKLRLCFNQLNDQKGLMSFLENAIEQGAGVSTILVYAEELQLIHGDHAVAKFVAEQMVRHPSIKGLIKLIEVHLKHASDNAKPSLLMLQSVVQKLLKNKPIYHCNNCGFDAKTLFWQCPSCKNWGSVKPIQGIEGE